MASRLVSAALVAGLAVSVVGCEGRPREVRKSDAPAPKSAPHVAVLDVTSGLPEHEDAGFLGLSAPKRRTFWDFLQAVEGIRTDAHVKGIFVRFGGTTLPAAHAEEAGDVLFELRKKGLPIHCHADGLGNTAMIMAARGCTKITVSPAGDVDTVGLAAQVVYLRKLLVEELKVSVDILQVGKFKGAEEPLTRDGPSDEARASLEGVLADLRTTWRDTIREGRAKEGVADAIEDGPFSLAESSTRSDTPTTLFAASRSSSVSSVTAPASVARGSRRTTTRSASSSRRSREMAPRRALSLSYARRGASRWAAEAGPSEVATGSRRKSCRASSRKSRRTTISRPSSSASIRPAAAPSRATFSGTTSCGFVPKSRSSSASARWPRAVATTSRPRPT
jgi:hypothetical protein